MEKIIWDASYTVGSPEIDKQHQRLIAMINALIDSPDAEYTSDIIYDLLTKAINYAMEHFKAEEAYMESIRYPGIEMHRKEHKKFISKIGNEAKLLMLGKRGPTDLLPYFKTWFTHHILYSDMKYMRYHRERCEKQIERDSTGS